MAKLHELLAVKSGISGKITKIFGDLADLFTNKKHHFTREIIVLKPVEDGKPDVTEKNVELQTTVPKELAWGGVEFSKFLDVCHTINLTNCVAVADVKVGDEVVLASVPATTLLELEKHITTFKQLIAQTPTLDPIKGFKLDSAQGEGIYAAQLRVTATTTKEEYPLVLAPATDKHPAQVVLKSRDIVTGHRHANEWSGMLTPAQKSVLLSNAEDLLAAVKMAQARANSQEVIPGSIGKAVVDYILRTK